MQARIAPSLGELEGTHQEVWGTDNYTNVLEHVVFMGLYGLNDFNTLWRHQGKRYIFWCGSDITHFQNGYHLEEGGGIRVDPTPLAQWINKYCESWVENKVEQRALAELGIESKICPSFMGNVEDYEIEYQHNPRPQVYLSVSGDNFKLYGWDILEKIAGKCEVDFHLYGNTKEWISKHSNVFVHGRVPKEQMNEEVNTMQCGLRLCVDMDGFSEITAKSVLWGQYPIVAESFGYPKLTSFRDLNNLVFQLNRLKDKTEPNPARDYYIKKLNSFPWNQKK